MLYVRGDLAELREELPELAGVIVRLLDQADGMPQGPAEGVRRLAADLTRHALADLRALRMVRTHSPTFEATP